MLFALVCMAVLAAVGLAGWVMAEKDLMDAYDRLDDLQHDLDVALGWTERSLVQDAVVHPTFTILNGGDQ